MPPLGKSDAEAIAAKLADPLHGSTGAVTAIHYLTLDTPEFKIV